MAHYRYQIFVPGGNKTALVFALDGLEDNIDLRKAIQDKIFARHGQDAGGEVEQVGFVRPGAATPRLLMTGGEFCGNAMRAATAYYLGGHEGEIEIAVSGASKPLRAGSSRPGEVWAQMPIFEKSAVTPLKRGMYWVEIEGISHLVVTQLYAAPYLRKISECHNVNAQKSIALELIRNTTNENGFRLGACYGAIFLEDVADIVKIHPFVYVRAAGTAYYETGCGSGAMCVGLVSSLLRGEDVSLPLLQPSGKTITAHVEMSGGKTIGKISGVVEPGEIHELDV